MKRILFVFFFSALSIVTLAEYNYKLAVDAAMNSCGTDMCIEDAMYQRGFNVDAMDPAEPSTTTKIKALFK